MAYVKNNWVDREGTTRYFETIDEDGALIFTPDYTQVTEMGTPVNADNMNHIEEGIEAGSFTKYDSMTTYAKDDLVTAIVENALKVYKSLQDNNNGNVLTDSSFWEEVEFAGGSSAGLQMFDTVLKDHILTYEESKGLALQGTYVYKEAVAGSRYGYPDFYAKCLEEYQNSTKVAGLSIPLPTFTANTTDGITVSDARGNTDAYTLMNGVQSKQLGTWSTYWFNIDYGVETFIKSYTIQADNNGSPEYPSAWTLQGSNDGATFEVIDTQSGITFILNETKTFTVSTDKAYNQYRLVFTSGVESSSNGELARLSFDAKLAILQNSNKHFFYDIAVKESVDYVFNKTGIAWAYGVDVENERVFLPRNNWFEQMTADGSEVGLSVEAGLPNITGTFYAGQGDSGGYTYFGTTGKTSGALFYNDPQSNKKVAKETDNSWAGAGLGLDASRSSSIYGNSDTVQPNAVKKLLYICVGNTETTEAITNVTEITSSENDTLPLLHHIPADELLDHPAWLRSAGQWNDGKVYTSAYEYLVNQYTNGTEHTDILTASDGTEYTVTYKTTKGKKVVDVANESQVNDVYSAIGSAWYYIIDQTNIQFKLPQSHNSECYTSDPTRVGLDVSAGLPNITGEVGTGFYQAGYSTGAFQDMDNVVKSASGTDPRYRASFDASRSNPIYGNSDTVTPPHTEFYLYFKVANAVQNLELLDVGEITESLASKVDINSAVVDGQPVIYNQIIYTAGTAATVDLSSIIPDDGNNYEVHFAVWVQQSKTSGYIQTTYVMNGQFAICTSGGGSQTANSNFKLYTGTSRSLEVRVTETGSWTRHEVRLMSYRRVGTNE